MHRRCRANLSAALRQRLDAEFALIHANGFHAASAKPSTNGVGNSPVVAEELVEVAPERDVGSSTKKCGSDLGVVGY